MEVLWRYVGGAVEVLWRYFGGAVEGRRTEFQAYEEFILERYAVY